MKGVVTMTNEGQMYRITIRATDEAVPPVLVKAMEDRLSQGIEGMA
jgi:AP-2 complex subunit alpha